MKLPITSKIEARAQIEEIGARLADLKKQCAANDVDFRPWISQDDPLAVQHWKLAQRRIALKEFLKKPTFSPERRQAASLRMSARRESSLDVAKQAISQCQTAI